ncbi:MAG: capsule assembly Wzi family protein [Deltaproteobacteria bacterium]|nr:capsule assembly Wzi family protein [Deltaproteobacteria bacterium]
MRFKRALPNAAVIALFIVFSAAQAHASAPGKDNWARWEIWSWKDVALGNVTTNLDSGGGSDEGGGIGGKAGWGRGGSASANVPVGSRVYECLERLELDGLIKTGLLSTRPISRAEGARLTSEAERRFEALPEQLKQRKSRARADIQRLKTMFREELGGGSPAVLVKPADRIYLEYLYSSKTPVFPNVNNNGDEFRKGANLRLGTDTAVKLFNRASLYLNPEFRLSDDTPSGKLLQGYLTFDLAGVELEAGRDSMWWGAGYHGDLLLTNNAAPFDMIKVSSARPVLLPWKLKYLGLFKPTFFLTHLEKDRDFPRASLLGMRLDFKPTPRFQIALNRVFIFGGEGRRSLNLGEWAKVFFVSDSADHADSPINGDQLASIDASYVYASENSYIPFSGLKLYTEWGAEDSSGHTKTPTGRANLYGVFVSGPFWMPDVDLRVEWANTARNARYGPLWYEHGVYTDGYRYNGLVIGHHMGGDAQDLFLRAQYHGDNGKQIGVEYDTERSGIHGSSVTKKKWLGVDVTYPLKTDISVQGNYGMEVVKSDNSEPVKGFTVGVKMAWEF